MPVEQHGAKGSMDLFYRNEESASSHRDQRRHIKLRALDAKTVVLDIEVSDSNAYKGTADTYGTKHFTISVDKLVELIEENGKSYHPPRMLPVEFPPQKPRPTKKKPRRNT